MVESIKWNSAEGKRIEKLKQTRRKKSIAKRKKETETNSINIKNNVQSSPSKNVVTKTASVKPVTSFQRYQERVKRIKEFTGGRTPTQILKRDKENVYMTREGLELKRTGEPLSTVEAKKRAYNNYKKSSSLEDKYSVKPSVFMETTSMVTAGELRDEGFITPYKKDVVFFETKRKDTPTLDKSTMPIVNFMESVKPHEKGLIDVKVPSWLPEPPKESVKATKKALKDKEYENYKRRLNWQENVAKPVNLFLSDSVVKGEKYSRSAFSSIKPLIDLNYDKGKNVASKISTDEPNIFGHFNKISKEDYYKKKEDVFVNVVTAPSKVSHGAVKMVIAQPEETAALYLVGRGVGKGIGVIKAPMSKAANVWRNSNVFGASAVKGVSVGGSVGMVGLFGSSVAIDVSKSDKPFMRLGEIGAETYLLTANMRKDIGSGEKFMYDRFPKFYDTVKNPKIKMVPDYTERTDLKLLRSMENKPTTSIHVTPTGWLYGKKGVVLTGTGEGAGSFRSSNKLFSFFSSSPTPSSVRAVDVKPYVKSKTVIDFESPITVISSKNINVGSSVRWVDEPRAYLGYAGIFSEGASPSGYRFRFSSSTPQMFRERSVLNRPPVISDDVVGMNKAQLSENLGKYVSPENLAGYSVEGQFSTPVKYIGVEGYEAYTGSMISRSGKSKFYFHEKPAPVNIFTGKPVDFYSPEFVKFEIVPVKVKSLGSVEIGAFEGAGGKVVDIVKYNKRAGYSSGFKRDVVLSRGVLNISSFGGVKSSVGKYNSFISSGNGYYSRGLLSSSNGYYSRGLLSSSFMSVKSSVGKYNSFISSSKLSNNRSLLGSSNIFSSGGSSYNNIITGKTTNLNLKKSIKNKKRVVDDRLFGVVGSGGFYVSSLTSNVMGIRSSVKPSKMGYRSGLVNRPIIT